MNSQKQLQIYRDRLLISRFQVRVLGGSLDKYLQMASKALKPRFTAGALVHQLCSNVAAALSEGFVHCVTNPAVHAL